MAISTDVRIVRPTDAFGPDNGNKTVILWGVSESDSVPYIWYGVPAVDASYDADQSTSERGVSPVVAQPARINSVAIYLQILLFNIENSILFCIILL